MQNVVDAEVAQDAPSNHLGSWTARSRTIQARQRQLPRRPRGQRLGHLGSIANSSTRTAAGKRIVDMLKDHGGRLEAASVRGLANIIGAKRSTVHNAIAALIAGGAVARVGSQLVLRG